MKTKLTKREKRIVREELKNQEFLNKKVRILETVIHKDKIRTDEIPEYGKRPKIQENPDSIISMILEWCKGRADVIGRWSWGQDRQWSEGEWENIIKLNLDELSKLTWYEIFKQETGTHRRRKKHHDMDIEEICIEAYKRWIRIGLEDYDTIFRFRFGGEKRLWGFTEINKFFLIWWDPKHKIRPSDLN